MYYKTIALLVCIILTNYKIRSELLRYDHKSGLPQLSNGIEGLHNVCIINAPIQALHASSEFTDFIKSLQLNAQSNPLIAAYQKISTNFNQLKESYFVDLMRTLQTKVDPENFNNLIVGSFDTQNERDIIKPILQSIINSKITDDNQKAEILLEQLELKNLSASYDEAFVVLKQMILEQPVANSWHDFTTCLLKALENLKNAQFNQLLQVNQRSNVSSATNNAVIKRSYFELNIADDNKQNLQKLLSQHYTDNHYPNVLIIKINNKRYSNYLNNQTLGTPHNTPAVETTMLLLSGVTYQIVSSVQQVPNHYYALINNINGYFFCNDQEIKSIKEQEFLQKISSAELIICQKVQHIEHIVSKQPIVLKSLESKYLSMNSDQTFNQRTSDKKDLYQKVYQLTTSFTQLITALKFVK